MPSKHLNRREILAFSGAALAAQMLFSSSRPMVAQVATTTNSSRKDQRYKISASDWMMLKRQTLGALDRGKQYGLDGVEVDMGPLGDRPDIENKLRDEEFLANYVARAKDYKLAISSCAMSAFYGKPIADHPRAEKFCNEWIDLMPKLGTKVGFLPIILKKEDDRAAGIAKIVALMKTVAPKAESGGLVLGLNTQLNANENIKLLDAIGSSAVRIAYNCGEAVDDKRDPLVELKTLGEDRIAQVIPTLSDGKLLQDDDRLDVRKLKQLLDDMGWSGWLVLQRSRDAAKVKDVKYNFSANAAYVKSIFQA